MRIATWNIGGGFISQKKDNNFKIEDINYFVKELKYINPDVICLQEVHESKNNNQSQIIAKNLGLKFVKTKVIAKSHLKSGEKLSLSIISRYPILSSKFYKLKNPRLKMIWKGKSVFSHNKGFVECKILYGNHKIRILCGHMVPFHRFGRNFMEEDFKQIRKQVEDIICKGSIPTAIGIDMNFENIRKLIPEIFKQGCKKILGNTPTTPKNKKFDKIIISKEWVSNKTSICKGKADHYLCYADIDLE